jgi:polysaccharide biosynthesis/export protein VpsN
MNRVLEFVGRAKRVFWLLLAIGILTGCGTFDGSGGKRAGTLPPPEFNLLRINDEVTVVFSGIAPPPEKFLGRIKEDGTITLPLVGTVKAQDLTPGQLEKTIYSQYVPKYYKADSGFTITVLAENRAFMIDGEVKAPSRQVYTTEMTVVKAIAAAGGFTPFAKRSKIQLSRTGPTGQRFTINYDKALRKPQLDLPVYPGDHIYVPRRIL